MDIVDLLISLPHHSRMGPAGLADWLREHGTRWTPDQLRSAADQLEVQSRVDTGDEWTDTRSRFIGQRRAEFIRRAATTF